MSFKRYLEEQKNTHMEHAEDLVLNASVEVAVFDPDGNFFPLTEDNDVLGWQSPKQVLEIISRFQSMA